MMNMILVLVKSYVCQTRAESTRQLARKDYPSVARWMRPLPLYLSPQAYMQPPCPWRASSFQWPWYWSPHMYKHLPTPCLLPACHCPTNLLPSVSRHCPVYAKQVSQAKAHLCQLSRVQHIYIFIIISKVARHNCSACMGVPPHIMAIQETFLCAQHQPGTPSSDIAAGERLSQQMCKNCRHTQLHRQMHALSIYAISDAQSETACNSCSRRLAGCLGGVHGIPWP